MQKPGYLAWSVLFGLVIASLVLQFLPQNRPLNNAPSSYAGAVQKAAPAVVNIYTSKVVQTKWNPLMEDPVFRRFFEHTPVPQSRIQSSLGSGVIMDAMGLILTNSHVIDGASEILVALQDGRTVNALIVGIDPESDLALLKIDLPDLTAISLPKKDNLSVGDVALAIGNPFGVGQTVTMGIISATGRTQLGITTYEDFIQTDAAVNPGNSGGALINVQGQLIGINTAIYSKSGGYQGIGFAIPLKNALKVMADLAQYGTVIRGWLGIDTQELSDTVKQRFGLPDDLVGQFIMHVTENSPASQAGLQVGDIVTHINGKVAQRGTVTMRQIADLMPGDAIHLRIIREGQIKDITAIAGRRMQPQHQEPVQQPAQQPSLNSPTTIIIPLLPNKQGQTPQITILPRQEIQQIPLRPQPAKNTQTPNTPAP